MDKRSWPQAVAACERSGCAWVLATVTGVAGSVPREPGCKMLITVEETFDSLGGGKLEWLVIQAAREHLSRDASNKQWLQTFPLAAEAQQCCGGQVSVLFEAFAAVGWQVAIFGAGHVAQRLLPMLAELPCRAFWIDTRSALLAAQAQALNAANVEAIECDDAVLALEDLPEACDIIIP